MEETGLVGRVFHWGVHRLFRIGEMTFLLSLSAAICLPLALGEFIRDLTTVLLLPLTLTGILLTWTLTRWNVKNSSSLQVLLGVGPLALFIRAAGLTTVILELVKQFFLSFAKISNALIYKTSIDALPLAAASNEIAARFSGFIGRLNLWFTGQLRGIQIEDPVARVFIWNIAVWLIAVWAGWQIYRHKRFLLGLLPTTLTTAFILDHAGEEGILFWVHLSLLLLLLGLTHFEKLRTRWDSSNTDYSDSTTSESIGILSMLTILLVSAAYFSSTISVKDILEDLREKQTASEIASSGSKESNEGARPSGGNSGSSLSHLILAGPELSNELVMTISTGDLPFMPLSANPEVPRYYWRTQTFQNYSGFSWTNPPAVFEHMPSNQPLFEIPVSGYRLVQQEIILPGDSSHHLYWTGLLVQVNVPFDAARLGGNGSASPLRPNLVTAFVERDSYRAESLLPNIDAQMLRESPPVYPDWVLKGFLALPDSVPERVRALARDLTASEPTPFDRAMAIQNHLRGNYPYTLEVPAPPSGREASDYFLFDLKQGYCDYYATSMAVMARAAGLPSRLVVGYANGFYDMERAKYIVTEKYAHSWVEIYFTDIGWVEFEPTAGEPAIFYDETFISDAPSPELAEPSRSLNQKLLAFFRSINLEWAAMTTPCLLLFWLLWDSWRMSHLQPEKVIQITYKRMRRFSKSIVPSSHLGQTAYQYAFMLAKRLDTLTSYPRLQNLLGPSREEIHQLTHHYALSLFAPTASSRDDARQAIRAWMGLRWRLILANILALKK